MKAGGGGVLLSQEGNIIYATEGLLEIFKCSLRDVLGKTLKGFIDDASYKKLKGFLKQTHKEKGETYISFITSLQEPVENNTLLYFEVYAPLSGHQEFACYVKPYATEKIVKSALSDRKYLEKIVQNINAVIWIRTPDAQKYLYMSPNYEKFFGMTLDEYHQNPDSFFNRIHPEDQKRLLQEYFTAKPESSYRYKMPDGTWKYFTVYRFTIPDCDDIPQLTGGITVDNTSLYKAQVSLAEKKNQLTEQNAHLLKLNEAIEDFTRLAYHDLSQPLRVFSNYIHMLQKDYFQHIDDKGQSLLSKIEIAINRMKDLIEGMANLSKMQGLRDQNPHCNVRKLFKEIIEPMFLNEMNPGIKLKYGKLIALEVNKDHLVALFKNLIENAIKYNDHQPHIKVWAKRFKEGIAYAVQDNGIGIPKEAYDKIFSLGFRLPEATKQEGTGIGLAACEKIMALYNGKIWVHSKPGDGSTFYLFFPDLHSNSTTISKHNKRLVGSGA